MIARWGAFLDRWFGKPLSAEDRGEPVDAPDDSGASRWCKDCRWARGLHTEVPECGHPAATYRLTDVVTGEAGEPQQRLCWGMRLVVAPCGPEARLFEPTGGGA